MSLQKWNMCKVCLCVWVLKAPLCVPWAVLTLPPCVVVVCVLNTCSPYPCHSGHQLALLRRVPGLAQLAAQEHEEHELRQPCLSQNHGGRWRRDPHRAPQRVRRPRVSSSEWQPQSAIHSASSRRRQHRQQLPLVLRGSDALERQMREAAERRNGVWNIWDMWSLGGGFESPFVVHVSLLERRNRLAHAHNLTRNFLQKSLKNSKHTHTLALHKYIMFTLIPPSWP